MIKYSHYLKPISRGLRKPTTETETLLWRHLRLRQIQGVQFYRQKPLGRYIVDFYGPLARLIIEVDGSQHNEPDQLAADAERDAYFNHLGLHGLRFDNLQVRFELEGVLQTIEDTIRRTRYLG